VLAEAGAVSRADLARRAALAPSTVSAVVSDLHAAGLVVEPAEPVHPPERPPVGRPPVLIAIIANGLPLITQKSGVQFIINGLVLLAASVDAISRRRAAATGR
jgi:hypothetical protein